MSDLFSGVISEQLDWYRWQDGWSRSFSARVEHDEHMLLRSRFTELVQRFERRDRQFAELEAAALRVNAENKTKSARIGELERENEKLRLAELDARTSLVLFRNIVRDQNPDMYLD